jgi:hypothetical protein
LPEKQLVSNENVTQWKWQVESTRQGEHQLHLTLSAILDVNGKSGTYVIRTFDRNIKVKVTLGSRIRSFVFENWQWLWTTVLVPICSWLFYKKWQKNKQKNKKTPQK